MEVAVSRLSSALADETLPLERRFRALFGLRTCGGLNAVRAICNCLIRKNEGALLGHELAYCLGQMGDLAAVPDLITVLSDHSRHPMVRHEAAEALAAIGSLEALNALQIHLNDSNIDVAETCQIGIDRLRYFKEECMERPSLDQFNTVDPAPPSKETDIELLKNILLDETFSLFERYRAMFALRNIFTDVTVDILGAGFQAKSALFRHEIAFVLGQMQHKGAIQFLLKTLENLQESEMVRHECAEALGSIATEDCEKILEKYLNDQSRVVRESCEVAIDKAHLEQQPETEFEYLRQMGFPCNYNNE